MVLTAQHLPATDTDTDHQVSDPGARPQRSEAQLQRAHALFKEMSDRLSSSHTLLQAQVASLQGQLDQARVQRDQELAEKACLASRLQNLLDLLPGGVVVLDGNGRVREANPAARELLGEPLEGQLWRDLIRERFAPRDDDYHEVSLRSGRRVSLATRSLNGEPGQIILINDQTETRQLQSQLARHERLSALGRMVASLAHQIRTPLSTAMLYASHLNDTALPAEHRQRFGERLTCRLQTIEHQVRDMLLLSKGDLPLTEKLTVAEFFDALRQQAEPMLGHAGASCRWDNRCDSQALLRCNQDTLIGAMTNLIDNAIQAGGHYPQLKVCARLIEGQLSLAVIDTGCGMDAAQRAQIGEPFFTTRSQGTGLGVSVVKSVAAAHGGAFFLRSKAGWGTCAELLLPLQAAATNYIDPEAAP
jgi:two-component system sensor histidine kinase FlrB